jgi:hypothetical protein
LNRRLDCGSTTGRRRRTTRTAGCRRPLRALPQSSGNRSSLAGGCQDDVAGAAGYLYIVSPDGVLVTGALEPHVAAHPAEGLVVEGGLGGPAFEAYSRGHARWRRTTVSGARASPEVRRIARRFWATRMAQVGPIVERAIERGQLRRGTRSAEVIEHLAAPLYYRLLVGGEPPTEADADLAAAVVLAAARAGVFTADWGMEPCSESRGS